MFKKNLFILINNTSQSYCFLDVMIREEKIYNGWYRACVNLKVRQYHRRSVESLWYIWYIWYIYKSTMLCRASGSTPVRIRSYLGPLLDWSVAVTRNPYRSLYSRSTWHCKRISPLFGWMLKHKPSDCCSILYMISPFSASSRSVAST